MIPNIAHFVFGLREQDEEFHFMHYVSIESCRRVLKPEKIFFHYLNLPYGPWWDRIAPHVTLMKVETSKEVTAADYSAGNVPRAFLYAHHADVIRLDALIEHGGIYADIDTVFVRPFPKELFEHSFVIGEELAVRDEVTGEDRSSLCNALMMSEPGAIFATTWRAEMAGALNGTWSNHSGFLSRTLADKMPESVHIESTASFFSFMYDEVGLARLLTETHEVPGNALSIHLWAHLWWDIERKDFTRANSEWFKPAGIRGGRSTLANLVRPYLPENEETSHVQTSKPSGRLRYFAFEEHSGYGAAAKRCVEALENIGVPVELTPFVRGSFWGPRFFYEPSALFDPFLRFDQFSHDDSVVVHLMPEFLGIVRRFCGDALLVNYTAWETDRIPDHWASYLNVADLVVVPSHYSAEAMRRSHVTSRVEVLPHIAPPRQRPGQLGMWKDIESECFVFYIIGDWNKRKGVAEGIESFLRAFRKTDPVKLIVKTSHTHSWLETPASNIKLQAGTTPMELAKMLARHSDHAPIQLITRGLTVGDIASLHGRGNCFISLCRGEGWGVGAFDAAAAGNPVVTTGYGGHLDYLAGTPYLVDFDLVPTGDPLGFPSYTPDQNWAEPNIDHAARLLREVFERRHEDPTPQLNLAEQIHERYAPDVIASQLLCLIEQAHARRQ